MALVCAFLLRVRKKARFGLNCMQPCPSKPAGPCPFSMAKQWCWCCITPLCLHCKTLVTVTSASIVSHGRPVILLLVAMQEYLGQDGRQRFLRSHRRGARRSETRSKKQQTKRRGRRQTGRAQGGASAQGGRTVDKYAWLQVRSVCLSVHMGPTSAAMGLLYVWALSVKLWATLANHIPPSDIKSRLVRAPLTPGNSVLTSCSPNDQLNEYTLVTAYVGNVSP